VTTNLRGADIVARSLERLGCERIFTLSGNHIMSIFDAVLETKIELVHVRHEAAAVHMADGWGRMTGQPGIAMVTGGPGHVNALGALFAAQAAQQSAGASAAAPPKEVEIPSELTLAWKDEMRKPQPDAAPADARRAPGRHRAPDRAAQPGPAADNEGSVA